MQGMENEVTNAQTDSWLAEFVAVRNKALARLDMAFGRRMLPDASDEQCLVALHKARYECTHIDDVLRHESARWLRERGMGAMFRPLEPEGELPE